MLLPGLVYERPETCSIPLRCGELTPAPEEVTQILGVQSVGEPFLSIPSGMSTIYASDCKELLGIPFEKIRGRHDSEIHLQKIRWEFTGVPHRVERRMGGRAPQVSVSVGRRPSHKGKAPVEEDGVGVSESVQGESSHPSSKCVARSSRDAEGVVCDTPDLGDASTFYYEDTVPRQVSLTDDEWEFLFVDRFKGQAHLSVVWVTRRLDYMERVAWGPVIAWEHITSPRPLLGLLAQSFPMIHCWSYGVWDSERIPSRLYYSLFLDTQRVEEINWTPMRVEHVPAVYASSSQAFRTMAHLIFMFLVMPTFPDRVHRQLGLPQTSCEITSPLTPIMVSTVD
ncbi:hypothetical protein AMTR_s00031p00150190 [Amborella trichopoda]|uniref:Aminotransferase-like plant mobile domain-containing protein n=1 Tax=Amborella trichopoda TaxID=13333 RepID=U5D864_AMBTC|nr:hypothetical protein AMTR_s00031p00150190 [Amborella trichopoda]